MIDRDEYLANCKRRALDYLNEGDIKNAITSMMSDLSKHDDFKGIANKLMSLALFHMMHPDRHEAKRFIEGFR